MFIFIAAASILHELCRTTPVATTAGIKGKKASRFDWTPVINAIIEVESEGNAKAVDKSGKSCGCMQITPLLVKECNRILDLRKSSKRYSMKDRFSVRKSKEMFLLYQSFYNPKNDVELAMVVSTSPNGVRRSTTER